MKLYVCWSTKAKTPLGAHACGVAYKALRDAGHDPEVVKARGSKDLPDAIFNRSAGRQEVKRLTGKVDVPVLALDDGQVIAPSEAIVDWAKANPARTGESAQTG